MVDIKWKVFGVLALVDMVLAFIIPPSWLPYIANGLVYAVMQVWLIVVVWLYNDCRNLRNF